MAEDLPDAPWASTSASTLPDAPWAAAAAPKADVGQGRAALESFLSGASANFRDEIYGASQASGLPHVLGGLRAPIGAARLAYEKFTGKPGEATANYERSRDEMREIQKQAEEQYPKTSFAGNVAGALALPAGGALQAATLPGRIGRAAGIGAGYGALYGAGSGEGAEDTAIKTATGAGVGALAGPLAIPVAKGVEALGRGAAKLTEPIWKPLAGDIRGAISPEREASRAVARRIGDDQAAGIAEMTPAEWQAARAAGTPVSVAELGGENTRELARTAGNLAPEAWSNLAEFTGERFRGQADRTSEFLRDMVGGKLDTYTRRAELKGQAKAVNDPAYKKLFEKNDGPVWDNALEHLAQDPVMQSAIRRAGTEVRTERTLEGYGTFNSPFTFEPSSGRLILRTDPNGKTIYPDLRFWDMVKRNLDKENTRPASAFASALRGHLDTVVPEYANVRSGAAKFFGTDNAITAGENFASRKMGIPEAQQAFAKMPDADKADFTQSFFAKIAGDLKNANFGADITKRIEKSPEMRDKIRMVLGDEGHKKLTDFVTVERGMDRLRTALGNSTTAKQTAALQNAIHYGLAGGVGGYGVHDNMNPYELGAAAVLGGRRWVNNKVAARVAEMLVSDNPTVLAQGMKIASSNKAIMSAFRHWDRHLSAPLAQQGPRALPAIQGTLPGHAEDNQP